MHQWIDSMPISSSLGFDFDKILSKIGDGPVDVEDFRQALEAMHAAVAVLEAQTSEQFRRVADVIIDRTKSTAHRGGTTAMLGMLEGALTELEETDRTRRYLLGEETD